MVRDLVFQIEPAEPAIGEVQLDFLGEPTLGADAVAAADDEHRIISSGSTEGRPMSL